MSVGVSVHNPLHPQHQPQRYDDRGVPIEMVQIAPAPVPHVPAALSQPLPQQQPAPIAAAPAYDVPLGNANGNGNALTYTGPSYAAGTATNGNGNGNGSHTVDMTKADASMPQWRGMAGVTDKSTRVSSIVRADAKRQAINLTWHNINFEVKQLVQPGRTATPRANAAPAAASNSVPMKTILSNVTGYCRPGNMLAIMGSSGAGKTSLLNCLAGRESGFTGDVLLNGRKADRALRKYTAFVQQSDLFYRTLTVREHLLYQAKLRLPSETPEAVRVQRVNDVMNELGLDKVANTLIGDVGLGGISGGERRRLSFANEVLLDPSLLFVDEPTSGLDSFMADNVVDILWQLSRAGRTIVCTIHQPSSDVFARFDSLCLLAEGRLAFFGSIGDAITYFSRLNFICPAYSNPADFFIKILSISTDPDRKEASKQQVKHILNTWSEGAESKELVAFVQRSAAQDAQVAMVEHKQSKLDDSAYITGWWTQFTTLISRSFTTSKRDPVTTKARLGQALVISIVIGLIYLQLGDSQKDVQNKLGVVYFMLLNQSMGGVFGVLQTFAAELMIFKREHRSQMYSPSAFFLSKTLSDFPFQIFFPIIFVAIAYWMVGLNSSGERYITCTFIIVLTSNCAYSLGYIIATAAPTVQVALAIGPVVLLPFMIFGGFLINLDSIPKYFYWLSYLSFFRYGFEALAITEFKGVENLDCSDALVGKCKYEKGDDVLDAYSFDKEFLWSDVGILIGLLVGFRFVAFLFLYRKSQQKEKGDGP